MIIREAILRGAGVEFVLTNRETAGDKFESWLTGVAGWYGGVGVVDSGSQRMLGHGFFPAPSLRTGRELTLSGTLVFESETDRSIADRFVSGLLWDGEFGELQVTTDDLTLVSQVKLGGEIKHAYLGTSAVEVQIPLTAPDPFLYGDARVYQVFPAGFGQGLRYPLFAQQKDANQTPVLDWGEVTPTGGAIPNQGNATAYPAMTVHGTWPGGFRIISGSSVVEYPAPVTPAAPVRIDHRTGEALSGGVDQTHRLTRRDWVSVPAYSSIQPRIEPLAPSTGWCDVEIADTYI